MKRHILLITTFFGAIFLCLACNTVSEPAQTPPSLQGATPSSIPSANLATPATPTPLPTPTDTPLPSPTLRLPPTLTPAPFLPPNLSIISQQNAQQLSQVALLPENGASVLAYSPDSRRVAAGFFTTNQVKIWDLASGQELLALSGHVDPRIISYLAFSPDGSRLASGAQGWDAPNDSLILWDASTGRELQRFDGVLGAISPDFNLVALTRREQGQETTLILADLTSGESLHTLKAPSDIYGVSFSPQGRQVAAKMYHVFQDLFSFWSVDSGRLDRTLYDWLGFSYSPDGRFIAALLDTGSGSEKGELNIFDAATFKWVKTLAKDVDSLWYACPAFSPDGQFLAASAGEHVALWETQTWKVLASLPSTGPTGFAFSPDGRILITHTLSGQVQIWGVAGGQ
jgi:WD40 repeat protein